MSTALVQQTDKYDSREMVETIKQTVCKGATDAQLRMFIEVCRSTGLNPFLKEVYYVPEKGIIMAARDGYLRVANENPQFDGMETRVERDDKNIPIKAVCTVWRKDRNHPTICEAYYSEYKKNSPVWSQYPSAMIGKVSEVLALKRSFSINGVVSEEEIGDGMGSTNAAQAIATAKIDALKAGVPAAELVEVLPKEGDQVTFAASELQNQLQASIDQARAAKGRKKPAGSHYELLQAFGEQKKRYKSIGHEKTYYAVLGHAGYEHANEFPDTPDGLQAARDCYKRMSLNVADLEALAAKAKEQEAEKKSAGARAADAFWADKEQVSTS